MKNKSTLVLLLVFISFALNVKTMPATTKKQNGLVDSWGRKNRTIPDKKCLNSIHRTCSRLCGYEIRKNGALKLRKTEVWWKSQKGYIEGKIWIDEHTQIRVKQHRWFMEKFIGRPLLPEEDVHHINEIKDDNRIENLEIIPHGKHSELHNKGRVYKKGYKHNLSEEQRTHRVELNRANRKKQLAAKAGVTP